MHSNSVPHSSIKGPASAPKASAGGESSNSETLIERFERDEAHNASPRGPLRRCVATAEILDKGQLLRFVLSPDDTLTFDFRGNLPGRGMWLSPTVEAFDLARRKGGFSRSAKVKVTVPADLETKVISVLEAQILQKLGLARRGGLLVLGSAKVEKALGKSELCALWFATDNSPDTKRLWAGRLEGRRQRAIHAFDQETLAITLGRSAVAIMGLVPQARANTPTWKPIVGPEINAVPGIGPGWHNMQNLLQQYFNLKPLLDAKTLANDAAKPKAL